MALPVYREDGWLPEGHHPATWDEIIAAFGGEEGSQRARVLARLIEWRDRLQEHGLAGRLILNGSFVSARADPGDFDTIFILDEGLEDRLAQEEEARRLVDYTYCRERGWGDVFLFSASALRKFPHLFPLDALDYDKRSGNPKGVVEVRL